MSEFNDAVRITVDASRFFSPSLFPVLYQVVLSQYLRGVRTAGQQGRSWAWTVTVPASKDFEIAYGNLKKEFMEEFGRFVLRELSIGRDYLGLVLASGGPSAVSDLGIVLAPLSEEYVGRKQQLYGRTQFFEKTGSALPRLLAQRPDLISVSGGVYEYEWRFSNMLWDLFNIGVPLNEQPARPALDIFRRFVQNRIERKFSGLNVKTADFSTLAEELRRL